MDTGLLENVSENSLKKMKNTSIALFKKRDVGFLVVLIVCVSIIILSIASMYISDKKYKEALYNVEKRIEAEKERERTAQEEAKRLEEERKKKFPKQIPDAPDKVASIYGSDEKQVYLTFDDGPSNITSEILDILKEEDVKATFFVLGKMVDMNPDILKREIDEGHYIANHTYSHIYEDIYKTPEATFDEYLKCEETIKKVLGEEYNTLLFRFPGGSSGGKTHDVKQVAKKMFHDKNIATTNWNCLTGDAAGKNSVESQMEEFNNTRRNKNSLIVLMHDAPDKKYTPETVRNIIHTLKDEGYTFKNFYEIFKNEG